MKLKNLVLIVFAGLLVVSLGVGGSFAATRLYVTNNLDNTVSVIDTASNKVIGTIHVGTAPVGIAYNPTNKKAYVVNRGDNTVSIIDAASHTAIGTVGVGPYPWYVEADPNIHNIDLNQWVKGLPVNYIYVTSPIGNRVDILISALDGVLTLPGGAIATDVPPGIGAFNLALDIANQKAYVVNCHNATLSMLDLSAKKMFASVENLENTDSFVGVGVDTVLNKVYAVSDKVDNSMPVIDAATRKIIARVKVGKTPFNVTVDSSKHKAYVTNRGSNTVSVVDTAKDTVEATIDFGAEPVSVALADGKAYVTNCSSNNISIVDLKTNTEVGLINLPSPSPLRGMCPWGIVAF